jgi:hypothetical protein
VSKLIVVHGSGDPTKPTAHGWTKPDSDLWDYFGWHGIEAARERRFWYTGDLDEQDWNVSGRSLADYIELVAPDICDRWLLLHSHAGQLLPRAAKYTRIAGAVMVGTPAVASTETLLWTQSIMDNIGLTPGENKARGGPCYSTFGGAVLQIIDADRDWIATGGQFGDGRLQWQRAFHVAGVQVAKVQGISHSELLNEPEHFPKWENSGWLGFLGHLRNKEQV